MHLTITPSGDVGLGTAGRNVIEGGREPRARLHIMGGVAKPYLQGSKVSKLTVLNRAVKTSKETNNFIDERSGAVPGDMIGIVERYDDGS